MKHAYLIIAHNEFKVLASLLSCLDDRRNTIFLHFDKKVKNLPHLKMEKSQLFVLENRVDVRWGDTSQIECELVLMEAAHLHGPFDRYTLLSGVHMPLKTQDEIHSYFEDNMDFELLAPVPNSDVQEELKMHRWNFMLRYYSSSIWAQRIWRLMIVIQGVLKIRKNEGKDYYISSTWFSITNSAVTLMVNNKDAILAEFRYSFCADEWFVRTSLERSERKDMIKMTDKLLFCEFNGAASPKILTNEDYLLMKESGCLFARKFSERSLEIVDKLVSVFRTN